MSYKSALTCPHLRSIIAVRSSHACVQAISTHATHHIRTRHAITRTKPVHLDADNTSQSTRVLSPIMSLLEDIITLNATLRCPLRATQPHLRRRLRSNGPQDLFRSLCTHAVQHCLNSPIGDKWMLDGVLLLPCEHSDGHGAARKHRKKQAFAYSRTRPNVSKSSHDVDAD